MGANFHTKPQAVFEGSWSETSAAVAASTEQAGITLASRDSHGTERQEVSTPVTHVPCESSEAQPSTYAALQFSSPRTSSGDALEESTPTEKFLDIASFLRETGHTIVRLKERMVAEALYSNLSSVSAAEAEVADSPLGSALVLFERAFDACEKVFCEENEGLCKARVLGRLLDPNSSWDFILVVHPERLSIAAGYVIHTGEFGGTKFSIAEYMWVDPEYRRSGLGGCFVDYVMQELRASGIDIHFGEIKDPCFDLYSHLVPSKPGESNFNPLHQFSFWQKQGRLLVDTMWPQPALLVGDQESLTEQLSALPLRGQQKSLSPELVLAVWDAKYGLQNWEGSEAEELGILETRRKLESWLGTFAAQVGYVSLISLSQARRWTIDQFSGSH